GAVKIVLLHAFPLDERMWERQLGALNGHEPIAPHLYSLGGTMDDWARRVAQQVDGPVVAIGASMGGYCAQRLLAHADVRALVLVAVGEHDPFFPADEAQALAASARNGRAHVFEGRGHLASLERPDDFNRVLADFLSGI